LSSITETILWIVRKASQIMPLNELKDSGNPIQSLPDVQRTSLSLDVLGRFICNTWDEAVKNGGKPFDAVVIGAGMFGGYCAEKIFRGVGAPSNLRVLVLEAGPFLVSTHVQNLPRIGLNVPDPIFPALDNGKVRELVWGMPWRSNVQFVGQPYCFGGKSLYWGGWCPQLRDSDLADWPAAVRKYLKKYYQDLEEQTGVTDREGESKFIKGRLFVLLKKRIEEIIKSSGGNLKEVEDPPLAVQGQAPASGVFGFDKYSSAFLLAAACREAAEVLDNRQRRLFVVPNTHVTRLVTNGRVVTGIQASVNGETKCLPIVSTCSVVLALGTIESTRLALVSFPTSSEPANELMGRNLISHIRTNALVRIPREALFPKDTSKTKPLQTGAVLVRGRTSEGEFQLQITASADVGLNSDALLFSMIPDIDQWKDILAKQKSNTISITVRGESQMKGDTTTPVPNANGRWINLSPVEKDEFGVPRAFVQFTTTTREEALADAMDKSILDLATALGGTVTTGPSRDPLGSTYHEAGTLWMGTNRATSVTDTNGRFHHIENAYCTDQSLFVNVGSVNPTLTGLVLSRKVVEAVEARALGLPPPP
jgi:choline dehydrogenase-like flavoprotein